MLLLLLLPIAIACLIKYHYSRKDLYLLAHKLPGPAAIPIIGNGLKFLFSKLDTLSIYQELVKGFPKPTRVWLGPHLAIEFEDPVHLEKILSSTKLTHKHFIYDLMKVFMGNGILSNSGPMQKYHRRIVQPVLNLKNVSSSLNYMKSHIAIFIEKFEKHVDEGIFNVHKEVLHCVGDLLSEILLGMKVNIQLGQNVAFSEKSDEWFSICYSRMIKPWFYPDAIYRLSFAYQYENAARNTVRSMVEKGIKQSRERVSAGKTSNFPFILDQLTSTINDNPNSNINDKDLTDIMTNIFVSAQDTITTNLAFLLVLLGMNPKYQKIAAEEVDTVVGKSCENITFEDLQNLRYLDMCIKEVLRLMPICPIIIRQTTENFKIDNNMVIPKGCGVVIAIMNTHRHPDHWEYPDEFYPDHFLPETVRKRHPYAFVPFSAGPRGCIGKLHAFAAMRLIMVYVLQRFEIEAEGNIHDIKLKVDFSVRSQNGYNIRLKQRKREQ